MEGFLSLADAAEQLELNPDELSKEITDGRVVAIVKDGESWISPGEVRRLVHSRQRESAPTPAAAAPVDTSQIEAEYEQKLQFANQRIEELEQINQRLKLGLQETESVLRRSKNARSNLENDIISLTDQLKKSQSRSNALEREVQHLTHELERSEERYANDMRRMRSGEREQKSETSELSSDELILMRQQMEEKDRIISQEYQERAVLRAQLEERNQKFFELKARYDKEKAEWSEILARELQTHGQLKSQIEELRPKTNTTKGWNPFRRDK